MDGLQLRDRAMATAILNRLGKMDLNLKIMHVCGTHQDTLERYGLTTLLGGCGVVVRQGPGCPVCVTTDREYEMAKTIAKRGVTVATFGDVARVPTMQGSLLDLRGEGYDVRIVYGVSEALELVGRRGSDVVFLAVGFETTAPGTATALLKKPPQGFSVLSCHRYVPPVLDALLGMGENRIDGLILPGHVSTVIGVHPYEKLAEKYKLPQVVAGFEPLDVLMAVYMIAQQVKNREAKVENEYRRAVRQEGNVRALRVLNEVFEPRDLVWRGFDAIPNSGMAIKEEFCGWDAEKVFEDDVAKVQPREEPLGCHCGAILRALMEPCECPLFGRICTPDRPVGPCMVSMEGACNIEYKHRSHRRNSSS